MYTSLLVLAGAVAAVLLIPLPSRVWAPFELQPYNAASVYVEVAGRLVEIGARPGDRVAAGDLIARLENHDLEFQAAQLEGERASLRSQEEGLRTLMYTPSRSEDAANKLTVVTETLAGVENRLRQLKSDLARLTITAPKAGVVIPAPRVPERPEEEDVELPTWTGTPLDERNIGATLTPESQQNLLCQVGDPNQWEAVLVIDQDDVDFVQHGQEVRLMFDESAYHVFVSKIAKPPESGDAMTVAPQRLASTNGGPLPAVANPDGTVRPLSTSYQATVRLDNSLGLLRNGLVGRARIETRPRTIGERLYLYFSRTFNFDL
jgi:putative peptide zinc metalloprotease protein